MKMQEHTTSSNQNIMQMKAEAEEEEEEEEEGEEEEEEEEGSTLNMFNGIAKPTREPQYHSLFSFANREDRLKKS